MAQTILVKTNEVGVSFPNHTLSGPVGSFRLNVVVEEAGAGKDISDIDDSNLILTVKDRGDDRVLYTITSDTAQEQDRTVGEVRWVIPSLVARDYELKAVAVPLSGTNDQYNLHWGYLSVTSPPSIGVVSISLNPLTDGTGTIGADGQRWSEVNAVSGVFSNLTVGGNLDVSGAISAVDTGRVSKLGDTMYGALTGTTIYADAFVGDGTALANLTAANLAAGGVLPALDGAALTNLSVSGGSVLTLSTNNSIVSSVASGFVTNNVVAGEANSVQVGGVANTISGGGSLNVIVGNTDASISGANSKGNTIIGGYASSRTITSTSDGNTIIGGSHSGDITAGNGGAIVGGGTGAGQHPLISASGQGNTIIGGNQSGRGEITGSVNGGTIIGGLGGSSISAGNASSAIGGFNIDLAGTSGYNGAFGGHTVAHNSSAYFAHSIGGIYITLNAPFAHSIGGWRVGNTGSNSVTLVGKDWTNSTANVVGMGVPVLFNGWGSIPSAGPAGTVIEAWVSYGSSNVKYAVSTIGTSIIQVIE